MVIKKAHGGSTLTLLGQLNLVQLTSTQILGVHTAILSLQEPENPGQDKLGLPTTWD